MAARKLLRDRQTAHYIFHFEAFICILSGLELFANLRVTAPSFSFPHSIRDAREPRVPLIGKLQTVRSDGDAGGIVFLHNAYRISDKYSCMGPRWVQVHRLHQDRHSTVAHLSRAGVSARPSSLPVLSELPLLLSSR